MNILFAYDYIDTIGFVPSKVRVKCKIIFSNSDQSYEYVEKIRKHYNPNNIEEYKSKKMLKLTEYHIQIIGCDIEESVEEG